MTKKTKTRRSFTDEFKLKLFSFILTEKENVILSDTSGVQDE